MIKLNWPPDSQALARLGAVMDRRGATGRTHECADIEDTFQWVRDLNSFIRGVGTSNISFWTHVHRRRVIEYPDAEFENAFCRDLDDKYRHSFDDYNLMVNDLYHVAAT